MRRNYYMAEFRLETPRLILRAWRETDLPAYHALRTNAQLMATMGPKQSLEECTQTLARHQGYQAELGYCHWVMTRSPSDTLIGTCGLKLGREGTPIAGRLEIGWQLAPELWGQGYAREAAQACLEWGWAHTHAPDIWAITSANNARSWGLMERLGMHRLPALDFELHGFGAHLKDHITYKIDRP
jgi:RimJ/RimL family protein N-acetyltransferase